MKKIIAVVGDAKLEGEFGEFKRKVAFELGRSLVDAGFRVQSGGLGGVMRAVFEGARSSERYESGDVVAILPGFDRSTANEFSDVVVATGFDLARNVVVANADAVVALGGGAGTLSEIANAWSMFKLIVCYKNCAGWAAKLAGTRVDERARYEFKDEIFGVESGAEVVSVLRENLWRYNRVYSGIQI